MYILGLLVFTQIVLESLPISSSTHVMLLSQAFTGWGYAIPQLSEPMMHLMHAPNIIVVCAALSWWYMPTAGYWRSHEIKRHAFWYGLMLFVSTTITVITYYLLKSGALIAPWHYRIGLLVTATLLLLAHLRRSENAPLCFWHAFFVGVVQSASLLPGVSRLGSTYAAGRILGWSPKRSLTYSLFLQLILMSGAFVSSLPALWHEASVLCDTRLLFIVGCAMLMASVLLRFVMEVAEQRRLWWLSGYLVLVSLL